MKHILIIMALLGLFACTAPEKRTLVGADHDAHGCIGSAGYTWNESIQQCVRPWELKK